MQDFVATEQSDLRGGTAPWSVGVPRPIRTPLLQSLSTDVLIVGAGITGSLMAEHLTARGRQVCVIDRERPGMGSTAASTAMLEWEIDRSLQELAAIYGFERAAEIYRLSFGAVAGLYELVQANQLGGALHARPTVYLAAGEIGARELLAEHDLRQRAGLPGDFLDHCGLRDAFELDREAAIVSPGSAEADPLQLSHALLRLSERRGAALFDAEATTYANGGGKVHVGLDNGCAIEADHVVLATGYAMPEIVTSDLHKTASSWVIATPRHQPGQLWRDGALIWEASKSYLYARTTFDGRIVIGGEDDDSIVDPEARDRLMPQKAEILRHKLRRLWPKADARSDFVWSGAFGTTVDGLPLIGVVPGHPRLYAAYGYGGNGITFSFMASRIIGRLIEGERLDWFDHFALDRAPVL